MENNTTARPFTLAAALLAITVTASAADPVPVIEADTAPEPSANDNVTVPPSEATRASVPEAPLPPDALVSELRIYPSF